MTDQPKKPECICGEINARHCQVHQETDAPQTMSEPIVICFEVPGLPKMTNTLRVHWAVVNKERNHWKKLVANAALIEQKRAARQFKTLLKARVTITRFSSKAPDYDGMVSGGKAILDGLVLAKVIIDDNVSVIGQPTYLWEKCEPRMGKIKVKVESIEESVA